MYLYFQMWCILYCHLNRRRNHTFYKSIIQYLWINTFLDPNSTSMPSLLFRRIWRINSSNHKIGNIEHMHICLKYLGNSDSLRNSIWWKWGLFVMAVYMRAVLMYLVFMWYTLSLSVLYYSLNITTEGICMSRLIRSVISCSVYFLIYPRLDWHRVSASPWVIPIFL